MRANGSKDKRRTARRCTTAFAAALLGLAGLAHADGQVAAVDAAQANNPLAAASGRSSPG